MSKEDKLTTDDLQSCSMPNFNVQTRSQVEETAAVETASATTSTPAATPAAPTAAHTAAPTTAADDSLHTNPFTYKVLNNSNSNSIKSEVISQPIEVLGLSKGLLAKIGQGDSPEFEEKVPRQSRPKIIPYPDPPIPGASLSSFPSSQIKLQKKIQDKQKEKSQEKARDPSVEPKFYLSNNSDDVKLMENVDRDECEEMGVQIKIGKTQSVPKQTSSCTGKTRKEKTNKRVKKRKGKNFVKQLAKYSPTGGRKGKSKHRSKSRASAGASITNTRSSSSQVCSSSSGRVSSSSSGRITSSSSQSVLKSSSSNIIEKNSRKKQNKSEKSNKLAAPSKVVTKVVKYRKKRKDTRYLQHLHILTKSVFRTKVDSQNSSVEAIPYEWLEETESETEFKSALENNSRTNRFNKSEISSENSLIGKSIIYHTDDIRSPTTSQIKSSDEISTKLSDIDSAITSAIASTNDQLVSVASSSVDNVDNLIPFDSIKSEIINNFVDNIFDLENPACNDNEDDNDNNNSFNSNFYMSY